MDVEDKEKERLARMEKNKLATKFKRWLDEMKAKNQLILLDGGFSQELMKFVDFEHHPGWTAYANFDFLDAVQRVYETYINLGCDIITTNTYHHCIDRLVPLYGFDYTQKAFRCSINIAHIARYSHKNEDNVRILMSIGSFATKMRDGSEYSGSYARNVTPACIFRYYWQQCSIGAQQDYDGVIFETIPTIVDVRCVIDMVEAVQMHDVIVSFCLEKLTLRDGTPLQEAVRMLLAANNNQIIGVGINCSDPSEGEEQIKTIVSCGWTAANKHIFIYPNSGESFVDGQYQGARAPLHQYVRAWHEAGALAIGGCCRVSIAEMTRIRDVIYEINGVTEPPIRYRPSPRTLLPPGWFGSWFRNPYKLEEDKDERKIRAN